MASSNVCNYRGEMIHFTFAAKSKLSLSLLLFLLTLALAQLDNPVYLQGLSCSANDIKNGSAVERNLKLVLNSLVQNANKTGYSVSQHGENGDKMYGRALCRGDLDASACGACVSNATKALSERCQETDGAIYLSGCGLRYATHKFFSNFNLSDASNTTKWCGKVKRNGTFENGRGLDLRIGNLLSKLIEDAVSSGVGYSTRNESGIYSLAQCCRDLSMNQCSLCLNTIYTNLSYCPEGSNEGNVKTDNCMILYASYKLYRDGVPLLSPQSGSSSSIPPSPGRSRATNQGKGKGKGHLTLLGSSIGGAVIVVMLVGAVVIRKRKVINHPAPEVTPEYLVHGHLTEKVDVYAFGVLVLEIISGRKNIIAMHANDMPSLLTMIWNHYLSGTISNIIDPNIEENCQDEVLQVVQVALLCTQASATLRPSMSKVIMFLTSKDPNLPVATQPPFIDINQLESDTNVGVTSNQSQSNSNIGVAHALEMYTPTLNIASAPSSAMSLNTISTSSFGPR